MTGIFDLVYLLAFLSYLILTIFITYHLVKYSGNRAVMIFSVTFFLIGTGLLLFSNALLFFAIPFDQFVPNIPMPTTYPANSPF